MNRPAKTPSPVDMTNPTMPDDEWATHYPLLSEHLTHVLWADGSPRQPSTLTMFVEDGTIKLCLNDREGSCSLFRSSGSLGGALAGLEGALSAGGKADWKPWRKRK